MTMISMVPFDAEAAPDAKSNEVKLSPSVLSKWSYRLVRDSKISKERNDCISFFVISLNVIILRSKREVIFSNVTGDAAIVKIHIG